MPCRYRVVRLVSRAFLALLLALPPADAQGSRSLASSARLQRGEVVVDCLDDKDTKFVIARIVINEPPERVWRIMSNPFEFEGKIFPRMKEVEVFVDRPELSVMRCTVDVCLLLPRITYVVESHHELGGRIAFKRVSGLPREFKGYWQVRPSNGGASTEVAYALYVDPGVPVPKWLIREGMKVELPRTLVALRDRVNSVYTDHAVPETRSILAAAASMRLMPACEAQGIHD